MPRGDSDLPMVSNGYNIDAFIKAIEKKDLLEIISFADKEATAAWRRAYRKTNVVRHIATCQTGMNILWRNSFHF